MGSAREMAGGFAYPSYGCHCANWKSHSLRVDWYIVSLIVLEILLMIHRIWLQW